MKPFCGHICRHGYDPARKRDLLSPLFRVICAALLVGGKRGAVSFQASSSNPASDIMDFSNISDSQFRVCSNFAAGLLCPYGKVKKEKAVC